MGKPFVITSPAAASITPHRDDQGRFTRPANPSPNQIAEESLRSGKPIDEVIADERVPDRPVMDGKRADADGLPKTQQWNDAAKKPFRV